MDVLSVSSVKGNGGKKVCLFLLSISIFFSCSCASQTTVYPKLKISKEFTRVLVLPFKNMTKIHGEAESVKSPLGNNYYLTGKIQLNSEYWMTDKLTELLEKQHDADVLTKNQLSQASIKMWGNTQSGADEFEQIMEIGKHEGVDGIFVGYIFRFRERVGNTMSVSSPASVIFELHFINMGNANIAWSGYYAETQKSLSEDLLGIRKYFKRGGKWITAEELASSGLSELLEEVKK